jgi:two-component system response regulator DesR
VPVDAERLVAAGPQGSTPGAVRLLIGHPDPEYARALAERLAAHEHVDVVGLAETPEEVVARAAELAPDVVVLDIEMRGLDSTGDLQAIRDARPSTRILLLVGNGFPPETGADAFIRKGQALVQLARSVVELASLVLGLGTQPPDHPR